MKISRDYGNLLTDIGLLIITTLHLTDCDVVTDNPKRKTVEIYQRDGLSNAIPEPELLPVMHGNDTRCRISEYLCSNKKCIPINRFCDGNNDCGDSSDEPRHCTRCNRTYYGDIGRTYELELHRPREDLVPYVCLITITAAGGIHGDLVQAQATGKLDSGMRGPYRVVKALPHGRYELQLLAGSYGKSTQAAVEYMVPWRGEWTPETCAAFFEGADCDEEMESTPERATTGDDTPLVPEPVPSTSGTSSLQAEIRENEDVLQSGEAVLVGDSPTTTSTTTGDGEQPI